MKRRLHYWLIVLCTLLALAYASVAAISSPALRLMIDGKLVPGQLVNVNGRHYVAVNDLAERFGSRTDREGDTLKIYTSNYASVQTKSTSLPAADLQKLEFEPCEIDNLGFLHGKFYNGSSWNIASIGMTITVKRADGSQRLSRFYTAYPRYEVTSVRPLSIGRVSSDVGFTLGAGESWSIAVASAKGYK